MKPGTFEIRRQDLPISHARVNGIQQREFAHEALHRQRRRQVVPRIVRKALRDTQR